MVSINLKEWRRADMPIDYDIFGEYFVDLNKTYKIKNEYLKGEYLRVETEDFEKELYFHFFDIENDNIVNGTKNAFTLYYSERYYYNNKEYTLKVIELFKKYGIIDYTDRQAKDKMIVLYDFKINKKISITELLKLIIDLKNLTIEYTKTEQEQ